MFLIGLILIIALLIPIVGIVIDSPIGRAMARRLEGPEKVPSDVAELARRVELLEAEVDDLGRQVEAMKEETVFLQRLIEDTPRQSLPKPPTP